MGKIHDAAAKGDVAGVQAALSEGAQVEAIDKEERTPLHIAALKGNAAVVKYLLDEREADQDAEDDEGNTPLHLAAAGGHMECVAALLDKSDADAENGEGNTPVWVAIDAGHIEIATALLEGEADPAVQCEGGQTYLHLAATKNNVPLAKLLLDKGCPVDGLDKERCTPLMAACKAGSWEVGKVLVEGKANVKALGKDSWTPLHFCAQNKAGKAGAIDFAHDVLVPAGASAKARTRDGMTPAAVVALDCGKRSKKVADEDDEMRGWLGDIEQEEDDE
uniref:Uncharacterized protein n=1 Tax=Chlamydomonas leiostraca TaxID=1034604 RepID=A0A7S0RFD2_9CHLO|mmetsp:Transcript_20705/g.52559  ORF Transcript_20705/g.52559 Transcript_20705/m.52559 type:complete len:277 (+) Transcript_20705:21-851(+)